MKNITPLSISLALIVLGTSCRISKKINKVINTPVENNVPIDSVKTDSLQFDAKAFNHTHHQLINPSTFSAKIKVESSDDNGKNPDITANIRIIKDSVIWVSLSATILGIEIYRAYITPDSVIILDKQKKICQRRSLDYLQEMLQIPLNFDAMQQLFLGNPLFVGDSIQSYRKTNDRLVISTLTENFKNLLTYRLSDSTLIHCKLDDVDPQRNRTANINYSGYEWKDGILFSTEREISLAEKSKIDISLTFKQYDFNKVLSVNFQVPRNYKAK